MFYKGDLTDVWFVGKGGKNLADWSWNLTDVFVLIPNVWFLMFRIEMGIVLPAQKLKKFVVEKGGGNNINNPTLFFKNTEVTEEVGQFARRPEAGGGKPGKRVFILSEDPVEGHSGKLWHCDGCGTGFPTKSFFDKHKGESCPELYERELLLERKKCAWGKAKDGASFPYGAPGSKAAKKNGFSPKKK